MKTKTQNIKTGVYSLIDQKGQGHTLYMDSHQLAGFKRSDRFKKCIAFQKICYVQIQLKITL